MTGFPCHNNVAFRIAARHACQSQNVAPSRQHAQRKHNQVQRVTSRPVFDHHIPCYASRSLSCHFGEGSSPQKKGRAKKKMTKATSASAIYIQHKGFPKTVEIPLLQKRWITSCKSCVWKVAIWLVSSRRATFDKHLYKGAVSLRARITNRGSIISRPSSPALHIIPIFELGPSPSIPSIIKQITQHA